MSLTQPCVCSREGKSRCQPAHRSVQYAFARMKKSAQFAFPNIPKIHYEGPNSKNPLAFKHYDPDEVVEGKAMKEHLPFSAVYWPTMRGMGADMFGVGTMQRPWEDGTDTLEMAKRRVPVFFEFLEK